MQLAKDHMHDPKIARNNCEFCLAGRVGSASMWGTLVITFPLLLDFLVERDIGVAASIGPLVTVWAVTSSLGRPRAAGSWNFS